MKQFISIVCIVLMLALLLVGCSRKENVSDNTDGMITESTQSTVKAPTTERSTTEATTTTEAPSASTETTAEPGADTTVPDESSSVEGRLRRGLMGTERY